MLNNDNNNNNNNNSNDNDSDKVFIKRLFLQIWSKAVLWLVDVNEDVQRLILCVVYKMDN